MDGQRPDQRRNRSEIATQIKIFQDALGGIVDLQLPSGWIAPALLTEISSLATTIEVERDHANSGADSFKGQIVAMTGIIHAMSRRLLSEQRVVECLLTSVGAWKNSDRYDSHARADGNRTKFDRESDARRSEACSM